MSATIYFFPPPVAKPALSRLTSEQPRHDTSARPHDHLIDAGLLSADVGRFEWGDVEYALTTRELPQ